MLFIGASPIGENMWVPTDDEPMPNRGPTSNDVDQESHMEFIESFNTTTIQLRQTR